MIDLGAEYDKQIHTNDSGMKQWIADAYIHLHPTQLV